MFLGCIKTVSINTSMWMLEVFNSPNFPNSYNDNSYCIWLLPAPKKRYTVAYLTFYAIDLTYNSVYDSQDSIWITEWGNSTNATVKDVFTYKTIETLIVKKIHTDQSPIASVTLHSDNNEKRGKGFSAGGLVSDEGKIFLALQYPFIPLTFSDPNLTY